MVKPYIQKQIVFLGEETENREQKKQINYLKTPETMGIRIG
jgi:hypothetical protein